MTGPGEGCDRVRDLIPELAMGVAPGEQRTDALNHIASCSDCRIVLELTTDVVDELMLLVPESEPPAGFEARVLAAMNPLTRRHRRRNAWLVAAAIVLAATGAGLATRWSDADDRRLADEYRQTLRIADGSYLRAAPLTTAAGGPVGTVFAYQGNPSWAFMTVDGAPSGAYEVSLVTGDGRVRRIGECWVRDGRGSWGSTIDEPISALDRIVMVGRDGTTLMASFRP
jgi:hypothetical protein